MVDNVTIELHHRGYLSNGPPYKYEGGTVDILICVNPSKLSYWELVDIVVELDYPSTIKLYYNCLILIIDDRHVMEMIEAYIGIEMWLIYIKSRIGLINLN